MTRAERVEVASLGMLTLATAAAARALPHRVALADVLLGGAAFLLIQGLLRDLERLARARREGAGRPAVQCMCIESTLGVSAIIAGTVLLFAWTPIVLAASRAAWPLGVATLGAFGFVTRNAVFDWRSGRLRIDPTHGAPPGRSVPD
jgi:hypothetical protein